MPILASDNFNRADENPLAGNWTAGPSSPSTFKVLSNVATPVNLSIDTEAYYSGITWPNDQFSRAILVCSGTNGAASGIGLAVRQSTSVRSGYRLAVDHAASNNVDVARRITGTYTSIARFTQAWTDGDLWEFRVQGTTLRVFLNSVQVGTDYTDSNITSGSAGIIFSSTEANATIDNWEGGNFTGGVIGRRPTASGDTRAGNRAALIFNL